MSIHLDEVDEVDLIVLIISQFDEVDDEVEHSYLDDEVEDKFYLLREKQNE